MDALWSSSINIAVPHIAEEFDLDGEKLSSLLAPLLFPSILIIYAGTQSWLISAYTLTLVSISLLFIELNHSS